MLIKKVVTLWVIAFVGVMIGVVFADSATTNVDDQTIEKNVKANLETYVQSGSYTIASYNHHVLLAGQVPTAEVRKEAEDATKKVPGVVEVWNYLKIYKNETASDLAKDSYLTSIARSELLAKKEVNSDNIKIVTVDRVVYLLGDDPGNREDFNEAIHDIKNTRGVKDVVNLIF